MTLVSIVERKEDKMSLQTDRTNTSLVHSTSCESGSQTLATIFYKDGE